MTIVANAAQMTPFSYSIATPESWTEEEQRRLEQTLEQYPGSEYSIVSQCAKIAARLPNKSIRDVGAAAAREPPHARARARTGTGGGNGRRTAPEAGTPPQARGCARSR